MGYCNSKTPFAVIYINDFLESSDKLSVLLFEDDKICFFELEYRNLF